MSVAGPFIRLELVERTLQHSGIEGFWKTNCYVFWCSIILKVFKNVFIIMINIFHQIYRGEWMYAFLIFQASNYSISVRGRGHGTFFVILMMQNCFESPSLKHNKRPKECSYTDSEKSFFHSSVKHHYIFITRRQMTEAEREREMNQAGNNTATRLVSLSLWDIWLHCLNLPFIKCCYRKLNYTRAANGLLI